MIKYIKKIIGKYINPHKSRALSRAQKKAGDVHYPISTLSEHIGKRMEVHYLDLNTPCVEDATLGTAPSDKCFYLSLDGVERHIVYWNNVHGDGRLSGVKLIKLNEDIVYCNDNILFDYQDAVRYNPDTLLNGPARKMTREYLKGVFG